MAGTITDVRGVTTSYRMGDGTVNALRGAELALASGELVVLLDPSGSGRSTLHDILGGLDIPATGRAFYRDTDITTASGKAASGKILTHYSRESVGCDFQSFNLVRTLTARENAALVTVPVARLFRPQDALELLGLGCRLNLFPAPLSDGEQQDVLHLADERTTEERRNECRRAPEALRW